LVLLALGASLLPAAGVASANSGATAIVTNCYYLNVRTGPGVGYGRVTVLASGTYVPMLGRNAGASWVQIQPIDRYYWHARALADALAPSLDLRDLPAVHRPPAAAAPAPPGASAIVPNAYYLNVRTGPGVGYGIVTVL